MLGDGKAGRYGVALYSAASMDRGEVTGRERRESERAIAHWERKREVFGESLTLKQLELGRTTEPDWLHRLLISIDPIIERSSLVLYGAMFAQLLHLPMQVTPSVPLVRQSAEAIRQSLSARLR